MKIVIQCAARKAPDAGSFTTSDGRRVLFVADPASAPYDRLQLNARPDDLADDGRTWRNRLLAYNNEKNGNRLGLLPAWRLYAHDTYGRLVTKFGEGRVFILSAGWGLIPATFLTPLYDITFTGSADEWKRRRKDDAYEDFVLMPDDGEDTIFLGGKDYQPLFCRLTQSLRGAKTVFFRSDLRPELPSGYKAVRYDTTTRTNWHYECARDLVMGRKATS
ncbi:MAG TPA: hypothetical protein VGF24_27130 [Vicinamibacterales bacterium]|jgi:hypothetical protein